MGGATWNLTSTHYLHPVPLGVSTRHQTHVPIMSEIIKDPNVKLQTDAIIDALKQTVLVFANTNANMTGFNPLSTHFTPSSDAIPGVSPAVTTPASYTVSAACSGIPITTPQAPTHQNTPQDNQNLQLLMQSLLDQTPLPVHSGQLGQGAPRQGSQEDNLEQLSDSLVTSSMLQVVS